MNNTDNPKNRTSLVGFTKEWGTPIALQNQMCSTCHQGGAQMFWEGSAHATHQLSCSDCHFVTSWPLLPLPESSIVKSSTGAASVSAVGRLRV